MTYPDTTQAAQLYLGSDWPTAKAQGPRHFSDARRALRFAFEHAAPVSLRGARLLLGGRAFSGDKLAALYRQHRACPTG